MWILTNYHKNDGTKHKPPLTLLLERSRPCYSYVVLMPVYRIEIKLYIKYRVSFLCPKIYLHIPLRMFLNCNESITVAENRTLLLYKHVC